MKLEDVFTVTEAAKKWGLDVSTLRRACEEYGIFKRNVECRKSGSTWLITRKGMERVYGKLTVEDLGNCQKVIIPAEYRDGVPDEEISDLFIAECLERLRQNGYHISTGDLMDPEILPDGSIEVYVEVLLSPTGEA